MQKKKLALFDFDHTISHKDSFLAFLLFSVNFIKLFFTMLVLSPVILAYLLKIINNEKAKSIVVSFLYRGWTAERFELMGREFTDKVLPKIVMQSATDRIQWHKNNGHTVYVVSASVDIWLRHWCSARDIGLICTKLEMKDNRFTGRFLTPNCYGPEKEKRIKAEINLAEYDYIYAYGDSRGDREMLAMADEPFYRHFKYTK